MSLIPFPSNGDKAPETMGTHDNKPPSACSALDSPPLGSASLPLLTRSGGSRLVSQVSASCSIRLCAHLTVDQSRRVRFSRRTHSVSKPHDIPFPFFVSRKKNQLSCSISAVPDTGRMQRQERAPLVRPRGFDPNQVIDATPQQKMRKLLMFVTVRAAVDYDALRCE